MDPATLIHKLSLGIIGLLDSPCRPRIFDALRQDSPALPVCPFRLNAFLKAPAAQESGGSALSRSPIARTV